MVSVGVLMPNIRSQLVDDKGREVAEHRPGELWIRGPNICLGYWKKEQATKDTIMPDGWLDMGDIQSCEAVACRSLTKRKYVSYPGHSALRRAYSPP